MTASYRPGLAKAAESTADHDLLYFADTGIYVATPSADEFSALADWWVAEHGLAQMSVPEIKAYVTDWINDHAEYSFSGPKDAALVFRGVSFEPVIHSLKRDPDSGTWIRGDGEPLQAKAELVNELDVTATILSKNRKSQAAGEAFFRATAAVRAAEPRLRVVRTDAG